MLFYQDLSQLELEAARQSLLLFSLFLKTVETYLVKKIKKKTAVQK